MNTLVARRVETVAPERASRAPVGRGLLAAMLAACVVGRGAWILHLVHTHAITTETGDAPTYLGPARELLHFGRFDSGEPFGQAEFLRTPGYPAFIAAVYRLFGQTNTAVLLAQVVLGACTVVVVYALATRMWSAPVGLLAALFTVFEPLQNAMSATLLTDTLAAFLLTTAALVGFIAFTDDEPRAFMWVSLGFLLALATLVRPALYYLPLFVIALVVARSVRRRHARHAVTMLVAFLVPLLVLVGGWQYRNHERVGSWRVSGIEAKNLYRFRAAGVVADTAGIPFRDAQHQLNEQFGKVGAEQQGPYYDRMHREAIDILTAHPVETASGMVRGLGSVLFSVRTKYFEYLGMRPASGPVEIAAGALLVVFYAVCGYGMMLTVRRRRALFAHAFVAGIAFYVLVTSAGPEAYGGRGERFRAPIVPILILYAAAGAYTLYTSRRERIAVA